jgi:hypothetical protein
MIELAFAEPAGLIRVFSETAAVVDIVVMDAAPGVIEGVTRATRAERTLHTVRR